MRRINSARTGVRGERHGMLTLSERVESTWDGRTQWKMLCDCGNWTIARITDVRSGNTKSCGCQKGEGGRRLLTTHGLSDHPDYDLWREMRRRCSDPSSAGYKNYGGRGITVCERWSDFSTFIADMGDRPSKGYTIERQDVDGNYEPSNCFWATPQEQARNRRNNVWVILFGKTVILKDACDTLGIYSHKVSQRCREAGETHQEAINHFIRVRAGLGD